MDRAGGAREGSDGHVWASNPSDYRTARRAGGDYLTVLGPQDGAGARAEVYTIFRSSRTGTGLVDLDVKLAGLEDSCPDAPIIRTLRSVGAQLTRDRDVQLDLGTCDATKELVLGNAIRDIQIARN